MPRPVGRKERNAREIARLARQLVSVEELEALLEDAGPETRRLMVEMLLPDLSPDLRTAAQRMLSQEDDVELSAAGA